VSISVDEGDVRDILDGESSTDYDIEVRMAEAIVNDELAPYADSGETDRLELTGGLIAAAYAADGGHGPLSSVSQGSAQVSYAPESDDALPFWERAEQIDPTGRLEALGKPTASVDVPDVR
jgi:hypothetical protein